MLPIVVRTATGSALLACLSLGVAHAQSPIPATVEVTGHRLPATLSQAIDANLYTTFSAVSPYQSTLWSRCGATADSEGCYGGGSLTGFKRICGLIEGASTTNGDVVTQDLYVLDGGATSTDQVTLSVYQFTDTITASFDTTSVALLQTIALPLKGGAKAKCSLAANGSFVYAGTSLTTHAVSISKADYSTLDLGGFLPAIPVTKISADNRGYVVIQFGSGNDSGFYMYGPDGASQGDGGGTSLIPNEATGTLLP